MIPRFIAPKLQERLQFMRVISLVGPRQSGKSTLANSLAKELGGQTRSLDNPALLRLAKDDPVTFLRHDSRLLVIDEVQRAPELILPLKQIVDEDPRPGRYLLTGSADLFSLRGVKDSLAGRVANLQLLPLSQAEIQQRQPTFLSDVFEGRLPPAAKPHEDVFEAMAASGYPSAMVLPPRPRAAWMEDYIRTLAQRDARDVSRLHHPEDLTRLLSHLALRSSETVNLTDIARMTGTSPATVDAHIDILETLFLVARIEPWFRNELKRLAKAPKLHFLDSGVLAHLRRFSPTHPMLDRTALGPLAESFVFSELSRQCSFAEDSPRILHMRSRDGLEVDFILEAWDRRIVAIEVKAGATVHYDWARTMKALKAQIGADFSFGVILHGGDQTVELAPDIVAAPMSVLWGSSG
jgi:uncharacterized protein